MKQTKKMQLLVLSVLYGVNFFSFFLPSIKEILFDDLSGLSDGNKIFGYQNIHFYINIFFISFLTRIVFFGTYSKLKIIVIQLVYLVVYLLLIKYLINSSFQNTPIKSEIEIGYLVNIISTICILIQLTFIKVAQQLPR